MAALPTTLGGKPMHARRVLVLAHAGREDSCMPPSRWLQRRQKHCCPLLPP